MSQQIHVVNSSEASVDPLRHTTDAVFVDDSGNPIDIGSGSSGGTVDAYTKSESDGRFASKSDLDGKLGSVATDEPTSALTGDGTESNPLKVSIGGNGLKIETGFLMLDMATMQQAQTSVPGVVTLKQITDTVADKLAAANIHTVGDDSVNEYTLSDVGYMLNSLITTLLSK